MSTTAWEVTVDFPAAKVNREKRCEACDLSFNTQREAAAHVVSKHRLIHEEICGSVVFQTMAVMPYGSRDRMLSFDSRVLYQGQEAHSGWMSKKFAEGIVWLEALQLAAQRG